MLPRAVKSLIKQTFTNWVCEVHCDKPDNDYPAKLIKEINDTRFTLHQHASNFGLTAAFNIPFRPITEQYMSILEEDNWWEPDFLQTMISEMDDNKECSMAWANMRIWNFGGGSWIDTQKNIWSLGDKDNRKFWFPHIQQIRSALHSQGSMLVRMHPYNPNLIIPHDLNSGALEAIRERAFDYPLLFVNQVLGNYAMLEQTHRPSQAGIWGVVELCLANSFFTKVRVDRNLIQNLLAKAREGKAKSIHLFLLIKIINPSSSLRFADFKLIDYLFFGAYHFKNFRESYRIAKFYRQLKPLRRWLLANTQKASLENIFFETCQ